MRIKLLCLIVLGIMTTALESIGKKNDQIIDTWTWKKSIGGENNPYTSTPETIGLNKTIVFTAEGKIITYKDGVEIRINTYETNRGISVFDKSEHELIAFEGKTYIIENIDNQSLIIRSNDSEGIRSIYKK